MPTTVTSSTTTIDIDRMRAELAEQFAQDAQRVRPAILRHLERTYSRLATDATVTAEDIFQEAVLRAMRYRSYMTTHLSMYAYLRQIADHLAIDHGKKEAHRAELLDAHRELLMAATAWGRAENDEGAAVTEPAVPDATEGLILRDGEAKLLAWLRGRFPANDVAMLQDYASEAARYTQAELAILYGLKKSTVQYRLTKLRRAADKWLVT